VRKRIEAELSQRGNARRVWEGSVANPGADDTAPPILEDFMFRLDAISRGHDAAVRLVNRRYSELERTEPRFSKADAIANRRRQFARIAAGEAGRLGDDDDDLWDGIGAIPGRGVALPAILADTTDAAIAAAQLAVDNVGPDDDMDQLEVALEDLQNQRAAFLLRQQERAAVRAADAAHLANFIPLGYKLIPNIPEMPAPPADYPAEEAVGIVEAQAAFHQATQQYLARSTHHGRMADTFSLGAADVIKGLRATVAKAILDPLDDLVIQRDIAGIKRNFEATAPNTEKLARLDLTAKIAALRYRPPVEGVREVAAELTHLNQMLLEMDRLNKGVYDALPAATRANRGLPTVYGLTEYGRIETLMRIIQAATGGADGSPFKHIISRIHRQMADHEAVFDISAKFTQTGKAAVFQLRTYEELQQVEAAETRGTGSPQHRARRTDKTNGGSKEGGKDGGRNDSVAGGGSGRPKRCFTCSLDQNKEVYHDYKDCPMKAPCPHCKKIVEKIGECHFCQKDVQVRPKGRASVPTKDHGAGKGKAAAKTKAKAVHQEVEPDGDDEFADDDRSDEDGEWHRANVAWAVPSPAPAPQPKPAIAGECGGGPASKLSH
jgi:hypothetical protein